jgi:hypothetical protein
MRMDGKRFHKKNFDAKEVKTMAYIKPIIVACNGKHGKKTLSTLNLGTAERRHISPYR